MRIPKNFLAKPYPYHYELTLSIDSLTNLGHGVGRDHGWVILVPFALPCEQIRARIFRNHKNYSEADLIEILRPSPHRVEPRCPLFGECGGCQYQHFRYDQQLQWKTRQVAEVFEKMIGIRPKIQNIWPSPRQYGYRSKITPHFERMKKEKPRPIGFRRYHSRSIVDVEKCLIATEAINQALSKEREKIRSGERKFQKGGTLLLRETQEGVVTEMRKITCEKVENLVFQFQAGEFFQNNPFILPDLIRYTVGQAKEKEIRYLIDAYCGVGSFILSASREFELLVGVEISDTAIEMARNNATLNRIENCEFRRGKAEAIFEKISFPPHLTSMIIDPPRKGCDPLFLKQLFDYSPAKVVYVSCDPVTQARDLKSFLEHNYTILQVQPFDLFPHTRHIESVVTLQKKN